VIEKEKVLLSIYPVIVSQFHPGQTPKPNEAKDQTISITNREPLEKHQIKAHALPPQSTSVSETQTHRPESFER
jgi:hypothetical protein